jgi:GTP cyclohydrolase I
MNEKKIEKLWKEILKEIDEDINRAGIKETPKRISKMYNEIFRGYNPKKKPKITTFPNNSDGIEYEGIICDEGYFFSHCEHHGVPFFGRYYFAYLPNKKIIGLSKVARVIDYFSAKLQTQERLTKEIVDEMEKALKPLGIALILKARHLCKEMRGVKKIGGEMITSEMRGAFRDNKSGVRQEFLNLIRLERI